MDMKRTDQQTITHNFHDQTLFQNLLSCYMGSFFSLFISPIHIKSSPEAPHYLNGRPLSYDQSGTQELYRLEVM